MPQFLSDADMEKLESKSGSPKVISDAEMTAMEANQTPGEDWIDRLEGSIADAAQPILENYIAPIGRTIDRYGGAPTRAAIAEAQDGHLESLVEAFKKQFGQDPRLAPTGKQIAQKAGLGETTLSQALPGLYSDTGTEWFKLKRGGMLDPTASGAAGLGIDVAADPLNLVPVGALAKGVSKTIEPVSKIASKGTELMGKAAIKTAESLTGVPAKEIQTYAKRFDQVENLIKKHGGSVPEAADSIREGFQRDIQGFRRKMNQNISSALESAPASKEIDIHSILERMDKTKGQINPKLYPDQVEKMDEMISRIKSLTDGNQASVKDLFEIKEFLQDLGKPAYSKGGQIFMPGKEFQKGAKDAATQARKLLNEVSPEIAQANNQLSLLHGIEDKINKNLIASGKPESALATAGSGANSRNLKNLQRLEALTGGNFVGKAEELAAAKRFASPPLMSTDTTGKGLERLVKGGGVGYLLGGPTGAAIGSALTSPAALKYAIKTGKVTAEAVKKALGIAGDLTDSKIEAALQAIRASKVTSAGGPGLSPLRAKALEEESWN